MSKTVIDIDDGALELAMAYYGTSVKKEAVNRALNEIAQRRLAATDEIRSFVREVGGQLAEMTNEDWDAAWRRA